MNGDTIGVRLTGASEGLGDHSGSVDGIDYFDCPVNSGVLTTADKLQSRKMTWQEEEELRKELLRSQQRAAAPPPPTSVPLTGLSPAALARMAQLTKKMMDQNNTPNPIPPKLPPTTDPPQPMNVPVVDTKEAKAKTQEETKQQEGSGEKRLSRLEILRQKKEQIRLRKMALQEKVQESKKQQQKQEQEQEQEQVQDQQEQLAATETVSNDTTPEPMQTSTPEMKDPEVEASANHAERRNSVPRDPLESLWVKEFRHESPTAAAERYEEDDQYSQVAKEALQTPNLFAEKEDSVEQSMEEDNKHTSKPLSRLQQLRQKKRLLEALPASISTTAAPSDTLDGPVVAMEDTGIGIGSNNNLANIVSAAGEENDDNDDGDDDRSSNASTLSELMTDMELENKTETPATDSGFQDISAATSNSLSIEEAPSDESTPKKTIKRRRMLGLGFLPTTKRFQKRRNTGNHGHQ